jgi:ATP-dependent exoDNAse (exonuclease V) beta subunit
LTEEIEEAWLRERAVDSMIALLDRAETSSLISMLGKGDVRRSVARELLQVVDEAYSLQRQCDAEVWESLQAPKLPDEEKLKATIVAFRSAQPRQKRLQQKLAALVEILETRDFTALVEDTLLANIALARTTKTPVKYYRSEFPEGLDEAFDTVYATARSTALSLLRAQNQGTGTVLKIYDHHITQLKHAARLLSFEDVGVRLATHFTRLNQQDLSNRMDGAIDHVLLDEFQDTSPIQWQVLYPLASRAAEYKPDVDGPSEDVQVERSFFCVGDTKQAIYGWRGGVAEIFDTVADQLPDVEELEQNESHRSSPVIMELVNRMFRGLPAHPMADAADSGDLSDKAMHEARALLQFAKRFPKHQSAKRELSGHVSLKTSRIPEQTDRLTCRMTCFEDAVRQVAQLHQQAPGISIGVLTRTNRGVAEMIFLLEQLGIEVSQEGGNPLTDSAAVEMVLSALMMADHPGDGRWAFHLSASPLHEIDGFGPDWVRATVEQRGLAEAVELLAGKLASACDRREALRLKQLCHLALQYDSQSAPRLRDFVRMVREKRVDRPQAAPVRVMTVHQAKGLEFDAVVLAELDANLTRQSGNCVADVENLMAPPRGLTRYMNQKSWHYLSRSWQKAFGRQAAANLTESLCLLYVAMTRARQALLMVIPPASNQKFQSRTFASLIFHALAPDSDPTQGAATLYESGDPDWLDPATTTQPLRSTKSSSASKDAPIQPIRFLPLPSVPRRNQGSRDGDLDFNSLGWEDPA